MTLSRTFSRHVLLVAAGLAALAGCSSSAATEAEGRSLCSPADIVSADSTEKQGPVLQGRELNGPVLQGARFNGINVNGVTMQGVSLQGARFNSPFLQGTTLQGIGLQGTTLQGTTLQGTKLEGAALVGLELVGRLSDGSTIPVFIEAVRQHADPANADITLYQVSYGAERAPLCGVHPSGEPVMATALANAWDEKTGARIDSADLFTFACETGVLYKCAAAGYKPWTSAGGESLRDYHQACTRMFRADYCGDGRSFTRNGTEIDVYDALGVQEAATFDRASFAFEATWGPDGATCIAKTRYPLPALPECVRERMSDSCETGVTGVTTGVGLANRSSTENGCLTD